MDGEGDRDSRFGGKDLPEGDRPGQPREEGEGGIAPPGRAPAGAPGESPTPVGSSPEVPAECREETPDSGAGAAAGAGEDDSRADTVVLEEAHLVEVTFKQKRKDYFTNPHNVPLEEGSFAVVQAERGEDLGVVTAVDGRLPRKRKGPVREVVRLATEEDLDAREVNWEKEIEGKSVCLERIAELGLEMKLVDVEWQLDGNKVTFYFTAAQRVDFRQLVKDLAGHFRTRIDLRQIGVRDEAKRMGGLGCCGRELCCSSWLNEFDPVTLKMARDQNLSLSPNKISGLCGRLMCCLGYEHPFYREAMRRFPRCGARVNVGDEEYSVVGFNVLRGTVTVQSVDGVEKTLDLDELRVRSPHPPTPAQRNREGNRPARGGPSGGRGRHRQ